MSEITVPDANDLILTGLSLSAPAQVNRSKWTGKRKVVGLPGIELWRAQISIDAQATEEAERPWRAFLWGLKGPSNWFRYLLPCATHAGSNPTVASGASDGYALPLTGLSASTTILKAGQFMTVPLPSGARRAVCLTSDLVSDGSGNATAAFVPALGEIPTLAATVETKDPFLPLSLVNPEQGFGYDGGVAGTSFDVEEAR